jgi:hypothetical protein
MEKAPETPVARAAPARWFHLWGYQVVGTCSPRWPDRRQVACIKTMTRALMN